MNKEIDETTNQDESKDFGTDILRTIATGSIIAGAAGLKYQATGKRFTPEEYHAYGYQKPVEQSVQSPRSFNNEEALYLGLALGGVAVAATLAKGPHPALATARAATSYVQQKPGRVTAAMSLALLIGGLGACGVERNASIDALLADAKEHQYAVVGTQHTDSIASKAVRDTTGNAGVYLVGAGILGLSFSGVHGYRKHLR